MTSLPWLPIHLQIFRLDDKSRLYFIKPQGESEREEEKGKAISKIKNCRIFCSAKL